MDTETPAIDSCNSLRSCWWYLAIGPYDYLIAAQARRRGATLVTLNAREFSRVPGLLVTDWAA